MIMSRQARKLSRKRFQVWLRERVDSGEVEGLRWLDTDKTTFRIPWMRVDSPEFDLNKHAVVFQLWAEFTGRFRKGERADPSVWKTRFRCAIRKMADIVEVKVPNSLEEKDGNQPYRVFRFREANDRQARNGRRRLSLPSSSSDSSQDTQHPLPLPSQHASGNNDKGIDDQKILRRENCFVMSSQSTSSQTSMLYNMNMTFPGPYSDSSLLGIESTDSCQSGYLGNGADVMDNPSYEKMFLEGAAAVRLNAPYNYQHGYTANDFNNNLPIIFNFNQYLQSSEYSNGPRRDKGSYYRPFWDDEVGDNRHSRGEAWSSQLTSFPSLPRISVDDVERILSEGEEEERVKNISNSRTLKLTTDDFDTEATSRLGKVQQQQSEVSDILHHNQTSDKNIADFSFSSTLQDVNRTLAGARNEDGSVYLSSASDMALNCGLNDTDANQLW